MKVAPGKKEGRRGRVSKEKKHGRRGRRIVRMRRREKNEVFFREREKMM